MAEIFKLNKEPLDFQLTVHYNNYNVCYGKKAFESHMRLLLNNKHLTYLWKNNATMANLLNHYGEGKVRFFLDEVINYRRAG